MIGVAAVGLSSVDEPAVAVFREALIFIANHG